MSIAEIIDAAAAQLPDFCDHGYRLDGPCARCMRPAQSAAQKAMNERYSAYVAAEYCVLHDQHRIDGVCQVCVRDDAPDLVNHPPHYTSHPSGIECITITRHMGFNLGNAVKYVWRADLKHADGGVEDLEKAAWYIADEIAKRRAAKA